MGLRAPRGAGGRHGGRTGPTRLHGLAFSAGLAILAALDAVAGRHGATPAQVALAWLMAQPLVTAPIASATSLAQLNDIMQAAALKLSADDRKALDTASA